MSMWSSVRPRLGRLAQSLAFWKRKPKAERPKKGFWREWWDAIKFAAIAAILIRTFLLEAFLIPTSSMESSLLVGDFLFVSKLHYGPRLPMVPLSIPFIHNHIPGTTLPSYLDWVVLPYARIPGWDDIEQNEVIVFNFPAEDQMPNNPGLPPITIPSLKENYIKRCVALPGQTVEVRNGILFVDGKKAPEPPGLQYRYQLVLRGRGLEPREVEELGLRPVVQQPDPVNPNLWYTETGEAVSNQNIQYLGEQNRRYYYLAHLTAENLAKARALPDVESVERVITPKGRDLGRCYPLLPQNQWRQSPEGVIMGDTLHHPYNIDWFGPITVPAEGLRVKLTPANLSLYRRCIETYEDHRVELQGERVLIDGQPAADYTFEMDYYFAMGDNRYNSQDSRIWGFVPRDHIVGKPLLVLLSFEGGVRWSRFFTLVR